MRNKKYTSFKWYAPSFFVPLCLLAFFPATLQAQIVVEDEDENDDEIEVIDEQGMVEEIDFPEAMTYNLDSLMNEYMSKTYLEPDNDCQMKDTRPAFLHAVAVGHVTGVNEWVDAHPKEFEKLWKEEIKDPKYDTCEGVLEDLLEAEELKDAEVN